MNQKTELNKDYIKSKIQSILNKVHNVSQKQEIKEHHERFNFACPICGDSQKYSGNHKKRGNFYFKNAMFKCFNCGTIISFPKLCEEFNEDIDINEKINLYKYIDENVSFTNNNNDYIMEEMDKLIDINEFMDFFNKRKNSWLYDIKPVEQNSHVGQYLYLTRKIQKTNKILQGIYRVVKDGVSVFETRVMISLNMSVSMNKLLGIQIRNLESSKDKRFYKIVEFEELYNYMHPGEFLDELEAISYNKLSHFYNILNVDFDKYVTVFEGFLDSLFAPNSIGLVGTNSAKDILFLTESSDDIKLRFFFDFDVAGVSAAKNFLEQGYSIFLWQLLFTKLIEKSPTRKSKLKNITDLNDLVIVSNNPNIYRTLKLDKFFSVDDLDSLYLPKVIIKYDENNNKYFELKV
jgi:predicted RNA-binding Zn-ribbon protein involved in translation (DUF1610 family)/guanylate kinase